MDMLPGRDELLALPAAAHNDFVDGGNISVREPFTEFTASFFGRGEQAERMDILLTIAASQGVTIHGSYEYAQGRLDAFKLKFTGEDRPLRTYARMLLYVMYNPTKAFPPETQEILNAGLAGISPVIESPYTHELNINDMTIEGYEADLMFNLIDAALEDGARARGEMIHTPGRVTVKDYHVQGKGNKLSALDTNLKLLLRAYLQRLGED